MRPFKRFRSWLGYVYCACLALGQQFGAGEQSHAKTKAAKEIQECPTTAEAGTAERISESASRTSTAQPDSPTLQASATVIKNAQLQSANNDDDDAPSAQSKYDPTVVNEQTAQRLARLLVSEIKLYYTSKANAGNIREADNIYDLLKEPIDQSRRHYKQRLGAAAVGAMPDYFHRELVRSLCAGDASRLGPNYHVSE